MSILLMLITKMLNIARFIFAC